MREYRIKLPVKAVFMNKYEEKALSQNGQEEPREAAPYHIQFWKHTKATQQKTAPIFAIFKSSMSERITNGLQSGGERLWNHKAASQATVLYFMM